MPQGRLSGMNDERPPSGSRVVDDGIDTGRRRVIAGIGTGIAAVAIAGCPGVDNDGPSYENGSVDDLEGDGRSAEETIAAEALAEREADENLSELDALSIEDHEFVLEDGFKGPTVQGTLANTGDEQVRKVELRVRVYDGDGRHLGRYLASTGDLAAGSTWQFEVILLEAPSDIGSYGVAALGTG